MTKKRADRDPDLLDEFLTYSEVGKDVPKSIADIHYKGTVPAIKQIFVYNPWDADANNVWLEPSVTSFVGRDDGSGMSPEEIPNFTRIGGSVKSGKGKVSPGGRGRYGEMGFGTKLLPKICGFWVLKTWKDGKMSVLEQEVREENLRTDVPSKVKVYRADPKLHGTELTLHDLTFDSDYSVDNLVRRLQWEVMILPDFRIFVGGSELVSKPIENATPFQFETEGRALGKAEGIIYLTKRAPAMPGIFVYVNGRSIGDPYERASRLTTHQGLVRKMIGIVNADNLQGAVMLGSEQFKEGDSGVAELDSALKGFLLQVRQEYDKEQASTKVSTLRNRLPQIVDEVRASLAGKGFLDMRRQGAVRVAYESEKFDVHEPVSIAKDGKTIIINPNSPIFHIDPNSSVRELQSRILYHTLDVFALMQLQGDKTLRTFFNRKKGLLNQFFGDGDGGVQEVIQQSSLSNIQMYSALDLQRFSSLGLTARAIREFVEHGLLKSSGGVISGRDFSGFEKDYSGFVPLSDLIYRIYKEDNSTFHFERNKDLLRRVGDSGMPFVYNVSRNEDPCYVVEAACADSILDLIGKMDLRRGDLDPAKSFRRVRDEYLTPQELMEKVSETSGSSDDGGNGDGKISYSKRIPEDVVPKVIAFAQDREMTFRAKRDGTHLSCCFGDFVYAYQIARGCNWVRDFGYEQVISRSAKPAKVGK